MAGPAPPAADELPGPARRLYSRWAGRTVGQRAAGTRWAAGQQAAGGLEQRRLQARNVAGTRPPWEAAGVGVREWGAGSGGFWGVWVQGWEFQGYLLEIRGDVGGRGAWEWGREGKGPRGSLGPPTASVPMRARD